MDVTVKRAALVQELGLARRVADRKTTLAVLSYALLDADMGALAITATDAESAFRSRLPAAVAKAGRLLVPTRTLHEIARNASSEDLRIAAEGTRVAVTAGSYRSTLATMGVDDFPQVPQPADQAVALPTAALASAIAKVKFVADAAAGGTSYHMHGALLDLHPGGFTLVATDGYRIAVARGKGPEAAPEDKALVPRRTLDDLAAMLATDGTPSETAYTRDESRVCFTAGDRQLVSPVIAATFPAYERVLPKADGRVAEVDRDAWAAALRRVLLVGTEQSFRVRFAVNGTELVASSASAEVGDASEPVPAQVSGEGWQAAFDGRAVADFLAAAEPGTVRYERSANDRAPSAFRSAPGEVEYLYVLAPMAT